MKKGKIALIIGIVAVLAVAAVLLVWNMLGKPLKQTISAKGYEISVPEGWKSAADGTLTDKNGKVVGKFLLINETPDLENTTAYAGFAVKGEVKTEALSEVITKNSFPTDSGKATQYFIRNIPNPEPYAISVTLLDTGVGGNLGDRIAGSLKIPQIGTKPPKKNLPAPVLEELDDNKVFVVQLENNGADVYHISLIDSFTSRQKRTESTGVDILSYKQTEEGTGLVSWSHLESDSGKGYLYTYYDRGDGIYTYDNNPMSFDGVAKEINEETGMTSYLLKLGETEIVELIKIPTNVYRDKAEELASMKTAESTDDSVMGILKELMPAEQIEALTAEKTEEGLVIVVADAKTLDRAKLSKDVAVLFGLNEDVDTITVKDGNGETFVFQRKEVMNAVENVIEKPVVAPEEFVEFSEEIEVIPPAQTETEKKEAANEAKKPVDNSGNDNVATGAVVYSRTVVISPSTPVRHPKTGKMVAVGPYAERMGYGGYLNTPISCVIKKTSSGYLATASCRGSVVYSRSLKSQAEVQSMISQFNAY